MEDEKLIELVREHEFVYNLKHPKYMDNVKKEIVWKGISGQLKESAGDCKKRWQCLRDAYRRALNKKKGKSEQEAKNMKPWKYEREMAFVAPFLVERKTKEMVNTTSGDELSDNGEDNSAIEFNAPEKPHIDIKVDDTPADVSDSNSTTSEEDAQNESQQNNTKKTKAVKRKADQSESSRSLRAALMAQLLKDRLAPPRELDDIDRFFISVADCVKTFPPLLRAMAKYKIWSLVYELELQQLVPPDSTASTSDGSTQTSTSAIPSPTSPDIQHEQIQQFFQNFNTAKKNKK